MKWSSGLEVPGKVNFILDNLIAKGKATPMIIVMDNGYARPEGSEISNSWSRGENNFEQMMLEDLIPEIDGSFRTIATRESRAIAGLSMGTGQAQRIGFGNLDVFASIGGFSGGSRNFDINTSYSGIFKDKEKFNKRLICTGLVVVILIAHLKVQKVWMKNCPYVELIMCGMKCTDRMNGRFGDIIFMNLHKRFLNNQSIMALAKHSNNHFK
jgi:hypothetical protein